MADAGYAGAIFAVSSAEVLALPSGVEAGRKLWRGSFQAVPCPTGSVGASIPAGCVPAAGYAGTVLPSAVAPYWSGTLGPAACPAGSTGDSVVAGCEPAAGFAGTVLPPSPPRLGFGRIVVLGIQAPNTFVNLMNKATM